MSKRRDKSKPTQEAAGLANLDSASRKLKSLIYAPEFMGMLESGAFNGVRSKILSINYQTIRDIVARVPAFSAIVNLRVDQVLQYARYTEEKGSKGYWFVKSNYGERTDKADLAVMRELAKYLDQTGFKYDSDREDDLADYLGMLVRETLTIDQIATEMQRNMKGEVIAFRLLDASYIKRVDPRYGARWGKDAKFLQMIDEHVQEVYTNESLIFDYKNKRVDIKFRGWGYSLVEQAIDVITTLLFGFTYVRDQMLRDRVPKGFLSVMGDVGQDQLDSLRNYWYAAMSGSGGQWNIPILPSGKDGVGVDFKTMGQSNRDMEYHKLMMFLLSIVAAVAGVDLAELGIKADDSTSLIGSDTGGRIRASKDRGLASMLAFVEQHINKMLRKVTTDYKLQFVGLDDESEAALADLRLKQLGTTSTINELRLSEGKTRIDEPYADQILNAQAVQIYLGAQGKGAAGGAPEAPGVGEKAPGLGDKQGGDDEPEFEDHIEKSMPEKVIRVVIE